MGPKPGGANCHAKAAADAAKRAADAAKDTAAKAATAKAVLRLLLLLYQGCYCCAEAAGLAKAAATEQKLLVWNTFSNFRQFMLLMQRNICEALLFLFYDLQLFSKLAGHKVPLEN